MLDIDLFKLKATTRSLWMLLMDTSKYHGKFIMFSKTSSAYEKIYNYHVSPDFSGSKCYS